MKKLYPLIFILIAFSLHAQYPGAPDFGKEISSFNAGILTPTPDRVLFGVEYADGHIWVNGFDPDVSASHKLYKFSADGLQLVDFYDQGAGYQPWKGIAWDGTNLYMANKDSLTEVSTATGFPTGLRIPTPINPVESVTYDPETDHFWVYGYSSSNFYEIDRNGNVYRVIANKNVENQSTLGIAWDAVNPGGPYLWTWNTINDYDSTYILARQIHVNTGNFTGTTFHANIKSPSYQFDYAGGATFSSSINPDTLTLLTLQIGHLQLNDNMDWVVEYNVDLRNAPLPGPYISVNPESIQNNLPPGDSVIVEVDLNNSGIADMEWSARIEGLIPGGGNPSNNPGDTLMSFSITSLIPTEPEILRSLEFANNKFWVGGRDYNFDYAQLFSISSDGQNLLSTSLQPSLYAFGWSAMVSDGQFLYGNDEYVIREYDMDSLQATGNFIPRLGFGGSSMAYDPDKDHFWIAGRSGAVKVIDREGEEVNFFATDYYINAMAWDAYTPGGPYLWIWTNELSPTGALGKAYRLDTESLEPTGVSFPAVNLSNDPGLGDEVVSATITRDLFSDQLVMVTLHESNDTLNPEDKVLVYDLDLTTPPEWIELPGATHGTVQPDSAGKLYVKLKAIMNDTIMTAEIKISSNDIQNPEVIIPVNFNMNNVFTSIGEPGLEFDASVYPNPARETINFRVKTSRSGSYNLLIYDLNGREVLQQTINIKAGYNEFLVDLSGLRPGMYHYLLEGEERQMGKIVIRN